MRFAASDEVGISERPAVRCRSAFSHSAMMSSRCPEVSGIGSTVVAPPRSMNDDADA